MRRISILLDSFHRRLAPYDRVRALSTEEMESLERTHAIALFLASAFVLFGGALVLGGVVDNKPTTASTGLVTAHKMVTLNPEGWFSEGIWWRGKQTPTPLPFTLHGALFGLVGYSIRAVLCLHVLLGAVSALLLYRCISARRFGPWPGLLAMLLYLVAPLPLYITFSGWTFVWATLFLLMAIDLLDLAVLNKRIPFYLIAGMVLGCAGMSRPENYFVAILVVLFVNIPLRYRPAFVVLAFLYPIAQYAHNNLYLGDAPGLRILNDARSEMGYPRLFREWFGSVRRNILNHNFSTLFQWLLLPAVLLFGLPRHRFLTGVLAYFTVALFAAYALRRISFNHEGYYHAHVTLAMPFLAALIAGGGMWIIRMARAGGVSAKRSIALALCVVALLLFFNGYALRDAYATHLFFRVPEPVREVRDFLQANLREDDRIALDYFTEVSWMIAEIEGDSGRDLYYYESNPTKIPRPRVNAARKDVDEAEQAQMNTWVGANYAKWFLMKPPRYLVTQSDSAWARERDEPRSMGHYRMYSLRPALGMDHALDFALSENVVLENDEFIVIEYSPSDDSVSDTGK